MNYLGGFLGGAFQAPLLSNPQTSQGIFSPPFWSQVKNLFRTDFIFFNIIIPE
jgi:hypothetical protein